MHIHSFKNIYIKQLLWVMHGTNHYGFNKAEKGPSIKNNFDSSRRRWSPMPFFLPGTPLQQIRILYIWAIQSWIHIIWIPVLHKNKCKISHQIVHLFIYSFSAYVSITISVEYSRMKKSTGQSTLCSQPQFFIL